MSSDPLNIAYGADLSGDCFRELVRLVTREGVFAGVAWGARRLDWMSSSPGVFVCPGLIDAHVHLLEDPSLRGSGGVPTSDIETLTEVVRRNLDASVRAGITCVRDMGGQGYAMVDVLDGLRSGAGAMRTRPHVYSSCGFLTRRDGHAVNRGILVDDMASCQSAIHRLADGGAKFIKVMNDPVVFSSGELLQLGEAAHAFGLPLTVHAYTDAAVQTVLDSGADVVEHVGQFDQRTVAELARRRIPVVTTFVAGLDTVGDPVGAGADALFGDANFKIFQQWYLACCESLPRLIENGVVLCGGTDCGFPGSPMDSLRREMASLLHFGMRPGQVLDSVTRGTARALGLGQHGELVQGKSADFVVFEKNPFLERPMFGFPASVVCRGQLATGIPWSGWVDESHTEAARA